MTRPDFRAALERADLAIGRVALSPEADLRIRHRLQEQRAPKARRWLLPTVAMSACAALALVFWFRPSPRLSRLLVTHASTDFVAHVEGEQLRIDRGSARLFDAAWGVTLDNRGPLVLRVAAEGVRIERGQVEVGVDKRRAGAPPARVFVSHGTIAVMGTHFTIEQNEDAGRVALHDGAITFTRLDGATLSVRPGETVEWPLRAPEPALVPAPQRVAPVPVRSPASVRPAAEHFDLDQVLERVASLRSRGRYEEGVEQLASALSHEPSAATKERLSFELGSLLTYQLHDAKRACAHWAAHRRAYERGRYDAEVHTATQHLACESTPALEP
jgi:transmembrane sensor